jgi:hypothetical protein
MRFAGPATAQPPLGRGAISPPAIVQTWGCRRARTLLEQEKELLLSNPGKARKWLNKGWLRSILHVWEGD